MTLSHSHRYNHRVQIFDPSGNFLRAFGSQGTADGKFSYPWGVTTDALGFIYVCDKENHRVQGGTTINKARVVAMAMFMLASFIFIYNAVVVV